MYRKRLITQPVNLDDRVRDIFGPGLYIVEQPTIGPGNSVQATLLIGK